MSVGEKPPTVATITEGQSHAVLGLLTILIGGRKQQDRFEKSTEQYLRSIGAIDQEDRHWRILDAVQEASWNEGDDPEEAAAALLENLGLEVGE